MRNALHSQVLPIDWTKLEQLLKWHDSFVLVRR